MNSCLIYPSSPTGKNNRIELAGIDLWILPRIDNIFVYPSKLDIDRIKEALAHALSLYPLVAGRFLLRNVNEYVIEMVDNGIPFSFVENDQLDRWLLHQNVLVDSVDSDVQIFLDPVATEKLMIVEDVDEPLFRMKLTHLVKSDEWILGISWAHVLGDACACIQFLHTFSRFYQGLPSLEPMPVFERRLWHEKEIDPTYLPMMKHLTESLTIEDILERSQEEKLTHEQINLHFHDEDLLQLRQLVNESTLTIHDLLISYIIITLNRFCLETNEDLIQHTNIIINYRGVSDSIAPTNLIANCTLRMISEDFIDPYSLSSVARSIRQSIIRSRDPIFLQELLPTADHLMRQLASENRQVNVDHFLHGIVINSNYRFDWSELVNLGFVNQCRFYTDGSAPLFLRVFRLNPIFDGKKYLQRDQIGAEVAFRIKKTMKETFLHAYQKDIQEKFSQIKL